MRPGYETSPCAFDVITMRISTSVDDLDLVRHGYVEVDVDPCYMALAHDGESLAFWRDPRRPPTEIKRFSPATRRRSST